MFMRRLRRNHSCQSPSRVIAIQTEHYTAKRGELSPQRVRRLKSISATFSRRIKGDWKRHAARQFDNAESFWEWVYLKMEPKTRTWLVCTDGREDLTLAGLWGELDSRRLQLDIRGAKVNPNNAKADAVKPSSVLFVWSNPPLIMSMRAENGGLLTAVSISNWLSGSLDDIANEWLRDNSNDKKELGQATAAMGETMKAADNLSRCFRSLADYIRDGDFGNFAYTAAGQSWNAYRHRWMDEPIYPHSDESIHGLERQAYYGGWIEPFTLGPVHGPVYHLDVNSLYPAEMGHNKVPIKVDKWDMRGEWVSGPPPGNPGSTVSEVAIDSPGERYPVRRMGRLCMATGRFCTTLCGAELEQACRLGHVAAHRNYATFWTRYLFRRWVEDMWNLRIEHRERGEPSKAAMVKMMLNGLTGKWAQQSPRWEARPQLQPPTQWGPFERVRYTTRETRNYVAIAGNAFEQMKPIAKPGTFPSISAFITALGRVYMKDAIRVAGATNVHYVGTDAVLVSESGYYALLDAGRVDADAIGRFRLQGVYASAEICGPASYRIGSKAVFAGRKETARTNAKGLTVQVDLPTLETILYTGPGDEIPEKERILNYRSADSAIRVHGPGRVAPLTLKGYPLRDHTGKAIANGQPDRSPHENRPSRQHLMGFTTS